MIMTVKIMTAGGLADIPFNQADSMAEGDELCADYVKRQAKTRSPVALGFTAWINTPHGLPMQPGYQWDQTGRRISTDAK